MQLPQGARRLRAVASFLLVIAVTFLGLLAVTFFIGRVIPIDPVLAIVGDRAPEHVIERVRQEMGLNLPLWQQFAIYLKKIFQGDFGTSVLTTKPVLEDIARAFPPRWSWPRPASSSVQAWACRWACGRPCARAGWPTRPCG